VLIHGGHAPARRPYTLTFGGSEIIPIQGPQRISLGMIYNYTVEPADDGWRVHTASYAYQLFLRDERPLISWHWHPGGRSPVTWPHAHVPHHVSPVDLSKAHVPTGQVSIQAVIRFAIEEVSVEPLRPDWRAMLEQTERSFRE
jgi:hypothetical protein